MKLNLTKQLERTHNKIQKINKKYIKNVDILEIIQISFTTTKLYN